MIFITVGSQKFQFNRLLSIIDELIANEVLDQDNLFAQIGHSSYIPKKFKFERFLDKTEINNYYDKADILITHAGTGSIINGLKRGKKVIVFPRDMQYGEHVDNHQYQISEMFSKLNFCLEAIDYQSLEIDLSKINQVEFKTFQSNNKDFIGNMFNIIESVD